jgi:broad specificity phosphatase PhoE
MWHSYSKYCSRLSIQGLFCLQLEISAGSRDSVLTNHGVQQAQRLGQYFSNAGIAFTHVFSSHLKRTVKTAEIVRSHQREDVPQIVQTPLIREQDFGWYEGKSYVERPYNSALSNRHDHRDEGFVDMEPIALIAIRVDSFLDEHLFPLLDCGMETEIPTVAVVSHGVTLVHIWKRLLLRMSPGSLKVHPELLTTIEHLDPQRVGVWTNTGFLELEFNRNSVVPVAVPLDQNSSTVSSLNVDTTTSGISPESQAPNLIQPVANITSVSTAFRMLDGWTTTINTINSTSHLIGLRRTGGGLGSAAHDEKQKTIDSFFKKRKL